MITKHTFKVHFAKIKLQQRYSSKQCKTEIYAVQPRTFVHLSMYAVVFIHEANLDLDIFILQTKKFQKS